MTVESTPGGGTVVTGDDIQIVHLLAIIKALDIEIKTGMKMRYGVSLTKIAKQYGATSRTKQGCRDFLADLYRQRTGWTI